jgi:hypothetical protein
MRDTRVYRILVGELREREHLTYQVLDGRIISKWIFQKQNRMVGIGFMWVRIATDDWLLRT